MTASRVRLAIELDGVSEKPTSCRRRQILAPTVLNRPFRRFIQGDRPKGRSQLAMMQRISFWAREEEVDSRPRRAPELFLAGRLYRATRAYVTFGRVREAP